MSRKKRLLVVDDSPTWRQCLTYIFEKDGYFQVVGTAVDGIDAVEKARLLLPDVITMDIEMPRMNGIEASRKIMEFHPVPIIIVSDFWETEAVKRAFEAMEIGAVAGVQKPIISSSGRIGGERVAGLVRTVKLMSEVPVIKRVRFRERVRSKSNREKKVLLSAADVAADVQVVVMGASTGGPVVLKRIFSQLPADFPLPIAVVQHISSGFLSGFIEWLAQSSPLRFCTACHGDKLLPGTVYLAPDAVHMELDSQMVIRLTDGPAEHGVKPSVSVLFRSVAASLGPRAVGILLTGMGKDGAEELLAMRRAGAVTIAQDDKSSLIFGMPGEAVRLGGATMILSPDEIASFLRRLGEKIQELRRC